MDNKDKRKNQNLVHSIRFDTETYNIIKAAAANEELGFAKFIKSATIAYIQNSYMHKELLESLDPQGTNDAQRSFFQSLDDIKEILSKTMVNMNGSIEARLKRTEMILEHMMFFQLYLKPDIAQEEKEVRAEKARSTVGSILKKIDGGGL